MTKKADDPIHKEEPQEQADQGIWKAHWIWGDGEALPRNEWRCFLKKVELPDWPGGEAELSITADARYVLYLNGVLVGRGPGRSWPFEQCYEVYEVGHLLQQGTNMIAVLVISFGVATFAYIPGRGGLLAQLEAVQPSEGPGIPEIRHTMCTAEYTEPLDAPNSPEAPESLDSPDFPEAPESLKSQDTLDAPESPDAPSVPGVSDAAGSQAAPEGTRPAVTDRKLLAATDDSWLTALHEGYARQAPRMSCQLGYAEQVDGRRWDTGWILGQQVRTAGRGGAEWQPARMIGRPGVSPWTTLIRSGIPQLTEETIWPSRVESLRTVTAPAVTGFLDVRGAMDPGIREHANPASFAAAAATLIQAPAETTAVLRFLSPFPALRGIVLNGIRYPAREMAGEAPVKEQRLQLRQGDNFMLLELAGTDHGGGLHYALDCAEPLVFLSPLPGQGEDQRCPYALIGPFFVQERIDHQPAVGAFSAYEGFGGSKTLDAGAFPDYAGYERCLSAASIAGLLSAGTPVQPFPAGCYAPVSVFAACVSAALVSRLPVPPNLQQAAVPNAVPGIVPVFADADTELILDFGKERSGYLRFEVHAPEGAVIDAYGFEHLENGVRQDTFGLDNTLRYICREGRQTYVSPVRRGFRYLMLTVRGASRPIRLYGVQVLQSNYPMAETGSFRSSDSLLNEIWEISRHTTRLCMEDTFVDCPAYEQVFWVGDSRNEALVCYYLFGAEQLVERCLKLVPGSAALTPLYADQVPSGWNSVIPNWTFFWVTACLEYVRRTGNAEFAKDLWPKVKLTLDHYLRHIDERGLLYIHSWNLLDWAPLDQPNDGVVTHQNAVLVRSLSDAAELAERAGKHEEAGIYRGESKRLAENINLHLWSEQHRAYIDCIHADGRRSETISMQTQVMALLCGVAQGGRKTAIRGYLTNPPAGFVGIGSPFMSFFYYEALAEMGEYTFMLEDMRRNYGAMLRHGATTCWEMYPMYGENRPNPKLLTRSHCHAWSAAPGYALGAWVLGIRPLSDGWTAVRVTPQPGDLHWAKGSVPLPSGGNIDAAWEITGDPSAPLFRLEVRAPENVQIEMAAPEGYRAELILLPWE